MISTLILGTILFQNILLGFSIEAETPCLGGLVLPEKFQSFPAEQVKFCPSWKYEERISPFTTLYPGENSTFHKGSVEMISGLKEIVDDHHFHVQVSFPSNGYGYYTFSYLPEDATTTPEPKTTTTTFLEVTTTPLPDVTTTPQPTPPTPGSFVTATLMPAAHQLFSYQDVHLFPGWTEVLTQTVSQTMVPGSHSNFTKHMVRVLPGMQKLVEEDGDQAMHARVYLNNVIDHVTIYLDYEIDF